MGMLLVASWSMPPWVLRPGWFLMVRPHAWRVKATARGKVCYHTGPILQVNLWLHNLPRNHFDVEDPGGGKSAGREAWQLGRWGHQIRQPANLLSHYYSIILLHVLYLIHVLTTSWPISLEEAPRKMSGPSHAMFLRLLLAKDCFLIARALSPHIKSGLKTIHPHTSASPDGASEPWINRAGQSRM